MQCHKELDENKTVGIDRVTKAEYEDLEEKHHKSRGTVKKKGIQVAIVAKGLYTEKQWKDETAWNYFLWEKIVQLTVKNTGNNLWTQIF